jgi:hypothetical protein
MFEPEAHADAAVVEPNVDRPAWPSLDHFIGEMENGPRSHLLPERTTVSIRSLPRNNSDLSLNHLIHPLQQRMRDRQPEGPCRLEIDHEMEPCRLFDGKITWFGTFQDPVYVSGGESRVLVARWPVSDQPACRKITDATHDGQRQLLSLRKRRD